jgi:hypothetical protein
MIIFRSAFVLLVSASFVSCVLLVAKFKLCWSVIGLQYQAVKGDHGFEHETCLDLTIEQCNEVNEKAKTEQVFLPRCSVFLTDRQEITVYKGKQTCTDWQIEYGSMTYEQWQEHKDQEFIDQQNEARENLAEKFGPHPSLSEQLRELTEAIEDLK